MSILATLSGDVPKIAPRQDHRRLHVLIIGAGVIGYVTAWELLTRGFKVTIMASNFPSFPEIGQGERITSQIGAALWEFPCPACGPSPSSPSQLTRLRRWATHSYTVYEKLAEHDKLVSQPEREDHHAKRAPLHSPSLHGHCRFGVTMRRSINLYPFPAESYGPEKERLSTLQKIPCLAPQIIDESAVKLMTEARSLSRMDVESDPEASVIYSKHNHKIVDARCHIAPVIDTDQAMLYLHRLLKQNGVTMTRCRVEDELENCQRQLLESTQAHVIVNAAGLGAGILAKDATLEPARGALLRFEIGDTTAAQNMPAVVVNSKLLDDHDITYVVPRSDRTLVVGTFLEYKPAGHEKITEQELDSQEGKLTLRSKKVVEMRQRAERSIPLLRHLTLSASYPLAQAWRPTRKGDARVERDGLIVHNYGHGVYGWTVAFGCAKEAGDLVEEAFESIAESSSSKARL